MLRLPLRALAAPFLVLALAGCAGDDPSESDVKANVADQLVDGGLDQDDAECFADVVVDELGVDVVNDIDFSADQPPEGQQEAFVQAARKALTTCELDPGSLDG